MKMRLLLLVALAAAGWYFASPWYTMWRIVSAAEDGDSAALEERIDFQRLRSGMHDNLRQSRDDGGHDLLDRIGDAVVTTAGGAAIDAAITPRGLAVLLDGNSLMPGQDLSWTVEHEGLNSFSGVSTWEDGRPGPVMHFDRDGLRWRMVGVSL